MRIATLLTLMAGVLLFASGPASAAPLALADHAAVSQKLAGDTVEKVARRAIKTRRVVRKRRWTSYRYWRPYQYYYWQHYYPYGGPLFGRR